MDENEKLIEAMAYSIVEEIHPEEVILFGSYAKGSQHPGSDVDMLVIVPDSDEARRKRRSITGRLYRRLAQYPVAKDILLYTRSEVERWRHVNGHVIAAGLREGRRLYVHT